MDIWIIIFIGMVFLVGFLLKDAGYSDLKSKNNIIKQPFWYFKVGLSGIIVFGIIGLYFILEKKEIISAIIMFSFTLLYVPIILFERNWKIVFNNDTFEFQNLFGVTKEYFYDEIDLKDTGRSLIVYKNKKRIVGMSYLLDNVEFFKTKIETFKRGNRFYDSNHM